MVINAVGAYAATVTIDIQQAAVLMEAINLVLSEPDLMETLDYRMAKMGQVSFTGPGVFSQAAQAMDILSKLTGIDPFHEECQCGNHQEEQGEESADTKEDAKPSGKPN